MDIRSSKVVIVGGSSGIGLGVARASLARGAHVVVVGREAESLARAREVLSASDLRTIAADATKEEDVQRMFTEIGELDHLVVTAGIAGYAPLAELELAKARRVIDTKVVAALLLAKHGRSRIGRSGSMTLTSGIAKDRPMIGGGVVAAANGAIDALARAFALELAPVRVNVVSPGWVETRVWDAIAGEGKHAMWEKMAARLPVGRIGAPADLAAAYVFAMENEFMTAATLHVDGGHALV